MTDSFFPPEPEVSPQSSTDDRRPEVESQPGAENPFEDRPVGEEDRVAAVMAYLPFLCFLPLVHETWKQNNRIRFHARQGIVLFFIELVALLFLIDDVARFVFRAVLILAVGLAIAGIYAALQGRSLRLPIIGDLADKTKL